MITGFDPRRRLVPVDAELTGPRAPIAARLLVDTGSAFSLLYPGLLAKAGYDLASPRSRVSIAGVSGTTDVALFIASSLKALGVERRNLAVLAHRLPASLPFDGLLGVNFLLGRRLIVDFHAGTVELKEPETP